MTLPTIHRNGTSANELYEQLDAAYSAVLRAEKALENATPNARDYYPQGDLAYKIARTEHEQRIIAVFEVRKGLGALLTHVSDQM